MVAVEELPSVVDHRAAHSGALRVGVAPRRRRGQVGSRQELRDRGRYVVRAAEGADPALLLHRILLLVHSALQDRVLGAPLRPRTDIVPVRIQREHALYAKHRPVPGLEHVLAVRTARWPVHQPAGLVRGRVGSLYAYHLGELTRHRLILLRRHRPVRRNDDAQPRGACVVLRRRVHRRRHAQGVNSAAEELRLPRLDVVEVKRHQIAPGNVRGLASATTQRAAHESAHVLQIGLLRLRLTHVLSQGDRVPDRRLKSGEEVRPAHVRLSPQQVLPG